jgi:hypothetical protein
MPIRVYYEVLNQKGTPALYSDNYAQRPAAGYQGRIFYSPDTAQIFYDTGSTWTLLADAGVGSGNLASVTANGNTTATGIVITANGLSTNSLTSTNLTAGSVPFIGTGGLFSQDNTNLFWDNTNKRLGINTNSPSVSLDIHGTTGVLVQVNNTGAADSKIAFLQASSAKWRIGNLYSGGSNLFHIYNNSTATNSMTISASNSVTFIADINATNGIFSSYLQSGVILLQNSGSVSATAGYSSFSGNAAGNGFTFAPNNTNYQTFIVPTGVNYQYTFPSATGTLALTSSLSSYLPLTGGTLSGALTINSTLYINPTNTGLTGLDVASNTITFRSDNLEGSKRQLTTTMGSGTLVQVVASGYGAARTTDYAIYTSSAGGVNGSPAIYVTGGNNVGILTGSPSYNLDVNGTGRFAGQLNGLTTNFDAGSQSTYSFIFQANSSNAYGGTTAKRLATFRYNTSDQQGVEFGYDLTTANGVIAASTISAGSGLQFMTFDGSSWGTRINILKNGVVQINPPTATTRALEVTGASGDWAALITGNSTSGSSYGFKIQAGTTAGDRALLINNASATSLMQISGLGDIGIGVQPSAGNRLFVQGSSTSVGDTTIVLQDSASANLFYVRNDGGIFTGLSTSSPYNQTTGNAANTYVAATGFLYRSTSSLKYKTDVLDYDKGLDIIKQMRPVYYKGKNDGIKQFAGFIAEEINNIGLTEFVQYADDGTPDALSYSNITALLTKGIQQLDTRLTNVEEALLTLQQNLN